MRLCGKTGVFARWETILRKTSLCTATAAFARQKLSEQKRRGSRRARGSRRTYRGKRYAQKRRKHRERRFENQETYSENRRDHGWKNEFIDIYGGL